MFYSIKDPLFYLSILGMQSGRPIILLRSSDLSVNMCSPGEYLLRPATTRARGEKGYLSLQKVYSYPR